MPENEAVRFRRLKQTYAVLIDLTPDERESALRWLLVRDPAIGAEAARLLEVELPEEIVDTLLGELDRLFGRRAGGDDLT